jgi:hypothetical protein
MLVFSVNCLHVIDRCYETAVARDLPLLVAMEIVETSHLSYLQMALNLNRRLTKLFNVINTP